ncbi:MAG: O-antigen ligase family protein [Bacteroidaceae bacterium]|nr:O-antigen ligase family protein [Bacteroidaceae bacterium]
MVVSLRYVLLSLWYLSCVLSCIDTGLFVYPSLSTSLLGSVVRLLMLLTGLTGCIINKTPFHITRQGVFFLLWTAYMLLHGLLVAQPEQYVWFNSMSLLVFAALLPSLIAEGLLRNRDVEDGIILIAVIQILFLILQHIGTIDSANPYFKLTGCSENPNVTAIYLVGATAFLIRKLFRKEHVVISFMILALSLFYVFVLRCRTAYIGMFLMGATALVVKYHERIKAMRKPVVIIGVVVTCLLVGLLSIHLYKMKQSSADGRIFIWKQTVGMIADNPVGVGYGMFERSYNNYVSEYFATHETERKQSNQTSSVITAYNDYLELGAEGGIIGILFLVGLYILVICETIRRRDIFTLSISIAYVVMSAVNFIIMTDAPWLLFLCAVSVGTPHVSKFSISRIRQVTASVVCSITVILLLIVETRLTVAQFQLQNYKEQYVKGKILTETQLNSLRDMIGTSEAYYTFCSEYYADRGKFQKATKYGDEALKYTSSPTLMLSQSENYEKSGNISKSISMMQRLSCMLPGNFSTKYLLMNLYEKSGDTMSFQAIAEEIIAKPVKIESEEVTYIKEYVAEYIRKKRIE